MVCNYGLEHVSTAYHRAQFDAEHVGTGKFSMQSINFLGWRAVFEKEFIMLK